MVESPIDTVPVEPEDDVRVVRRPGVLQQVASTIEGRIGLLLTGLVFALVVFGSFVAPYSPIQSEVGPVAASSSTAHWLGTDALGRDVLSRVLYGGRLILLTAASGILIAYCAGLVVGIFAALRGGWIDTILLRVFDAHSSIPYLIFFLIIVSAVGNSPIVIVLVLAFVYFPGRVIRGLARPIVEMDYIRAARARGESNFAIMIREVAPNLIGPVVASAAVSFQHAIITVAVVNFIGIGVQPPTPDWAVMIFESRTLISVQPLAIVGPMICLSVMSVGVNLFATALAKVLTRDQR